MIPRAVVIMLLSGCGAALDLKTSEASLAAMRGVLEAKCPVGTYITNTQCVTALKLYNGAATAYNTALLRDQAGMKQVPIDLYLREAQGYISAFVEAFGL